MSWEKGIYLAKQYSIKIIICFVVVLVWWLHAEGAMQLSLTQTSYMMLIVGVLSVGWMLYKLWHEEVQSPLFVAVPLFAWVYFIWQAISQSGVLTKNVMFVADSFLPYHPFFYGILAFMVTLPIYLIARLGWVQYHLSA